MNHSSNDVSVHLRENWVAPLSPLLVTTRLGLLVRALARHHSEGTIAELLGDLELAYALARADQATSDEALGELRSVWHERHRHTTHVCSDELVLVAVLGRPARFAATVVLDAATVWRLTERCVLAVLPAYAADVLEHDVGWFHVSARVHAPVNDTHTALLAAMILDGDPTPTEILERVPLFSEAARILCE